MLLHIIRTLFVINFVIHNFNEFSKRECDSRSCDVSIIGSTGNYASHNIYCSILQSMNVQSVARYWRFQSTTTPTAAHETRFLMGLFFRSFSFWCNIWYKVWFLKKVFIVGFFGNKYTTGYILVSFYILRRRLDFQLGVPKDSTFQSIKFN